MRGIGQIDGAVIFYRVFITGRPRCNQSVFSELLSAVERDVECKGSGDAFRKLAGVCNIAL